MYVATESNSQLRVTTVAFFCRAEKHAERKEEVNNNKEERKQRSQQVSESQAKLELLGFLRFMDLPFLHSRTSVKHNIPLGLYFCAVFFSTSRIYCELTVCLFVYCVTEAVEQICSPA